MTTTTGTLQERFKDLHGVLTQRHVERYDEVELGLIAVLAKYHFVLIGPPGTAKSMLARDLCGAFEGAHYFEHLMTKFTVPEEIFGPINIAKLELGLYERNITGMAPEAHIMFQDEVFKSNSAVLNAELQLMNERTYKHGSTIVHTPLISLFGASNELPEGEELAALFDRFHLRKRVEYITEPGNFQRMLRTDTSPIGAIMTLDHLLAAQKEVTNVETPDDVYETIYEIRADLQLEGILVSDRRYNQSIKALQAMAWLSGSDTVTDNDFRILQHMFWSNPLDVKKVSRVVLQHTNPLEMAAEEFMDQIDEVSGQLVSALMDCKQKGLNPKEALTKQGIEWFARCRTISEELKQLKSKAERQGRSLNRIEQAQDRVVQVAREVGRNTIGFDSMEVKRT